MKVLVVEDEAIVCELLANLVEREFGFEVTAQVHDGGAALKAFRKTEADLVITDLLLPNMDGLELARQLLEIDPKVHILAISSECDEFTISEIYRSGILGFLDKNTMDVERLRAAIGKVADGRTCYSEAASKVIRRLIAAPDAFYKILTKREMQVVRLIAEGKNQEAIGGELGISALTVRRHKHNAMRKIDVHNEAELLRYALNKGIVKSKGGLDWTGPVPG